MPAKRFWILKILLICSLVFGSVLTASAAGGPSLVLSPASKGVNVGATFNLEILLDTGGKEVAGADIFRLNFEPQLLEATKIAKGSIFPTYLGENIDNGKGAISFSGIVSPGGRGYSGSGTFATIVFKAKSKGTANLRFDFKSDSTEDTNIIDYSTGKDILASVSGAQVSIFGDGETIPENLNTASSNGSQGSNETETQGGTRSPGNNSQAVSPSGAGSDTKTGGLIVPFMQKETKIAGAKFSNGTIILVAANVILLVLAIVFGIRYKKKKYERTWQNRP